MFHLMITKKNINFLPNRFIESVSFRLRTFLLLFLLPIIYISQVDTIISSLKTKPIFGFKIETKYFNLDKDFSQFREVKPYIEFNKVIRFGVGYCWLKKINGRPLRINSFTFFSEYLINLDQSWSAEIPIDVGIGKVIDPNQGEGSYFHLEPSFIIEYKGFSCFNLGIGTGLRLSTHNKDIYKESLTFQTFIFRLNLKFVEIYKYFSQLKD